MPKPSVFNQTFPFRQHFRSQLISGQWSNGSPNWDRSRFWPTDPWCVTIMLLHLVFVRDVIAPSVCNENVKVFTVSKMSTVNTGVILDTVSTARIVCTGFKANPPRIRVHPACDKDGGHIIRSTIAENPMLHENFTALSSTEPELLTTEDSYCTKREFQALLPLTLTLTWWPSYNNLPRTPLRYPSALKVIFLRECFRKSSYYIHTNRHTSHT